jgi:hypothetical protein
MNSSICTRPKAMWRNRLRHSDWATYYNLFIVGLETKSNRVAEPLLIREASDGAGQAGLASGKSEATTQQQCANPEQH